MPVLILEADEKLSGRVEPGLADIPAKLRLGQQVGGHGIAEFVVAFADIFDVTLDAEVLPAERKRVCPVEVDTCNLSSTVWAFVKMNSTVIS